jgi:hypothetical protein
MGAEVGSFSLGGERAEEDKPAAVGAGGGGTDEPGATLSLSAEDGGAEGDASFHALSQPPGTCFPVDILEMGGGLCTPCPGNAVPT